MCGIVGYAGERQAAPILLDGLTKLEYRGYDSAGIVVRDGAAETTIVKAKGRLETLIEMTDNGRSVPGCCGIGHTRWATHGEPSEANAHPHVSDADDIPNVAAVHNGIIENYQDIRNKMLKNGYRFYSQTDTEALVKLIDYYYKKYNMGPIDALAKTMVRVKGSYAIAVMFKDYPGEIYAARLDSPMIIGVNGGESFIASDVPAILKHTTSVYYMENMEMARIVPGHVDFYNIDGDIVEKEPTEIDWSSESAEKGGFEHFMIKEIHEQPMAIKETLKSAIKMNPDTNSYEINIPEIDLSDDQIRNIERLHFVACGSAYHVGVVARYVFGELAQIPVSVDYASEFRYRDPILHKNDIVVLISQSGETADTLAALRGAKAKGIRTIGIVNVFGSSVAREADSIFYTMAGPEIAVATTKAYSAQLVAAYLLAIQFAKVRGTIKDDYYRHLLNELMALPAKVERILDDKDRIQKFAAKFANVKDMFFIGRGIDYAVSLEGSLKMKEISYIHSEAYAAGELKHGTISLVEDGTLVVGIMTQKQLYDKTVSNMMEVKTRGAYLAGITTYGNYRIKNTVDFCFYVPNTEKYFTASLSVIPLQLMSYYVTIAKGLDVDKPRNLAKSVTVE